MYGKKDEINSIFGEFHFALKELDKIMERIVTVVNQIPTGLDEHNYAIAVERELRNRADTFSRMGKVRDKKLTSQKRQREVKVYGRVFD